MRDAFAAQPDDDFDLPAVVRRKSPARPQKSSQKAKRKSGAGELLMAWALSHPRQLVTALFLTGCGGIIAWNALMLQSSRHPAPLFNQSNLAVEEEPILLPETELGPYQPLPPARPVAEGPDAHALAPAEPAPEGHAPAVPDQSVSSPRLPARAAVADAVRRNEEAAAAMPARARQAAAPPVPVPARAPVSRDPIGDMIRMGGPVPVPPANVGVAQGSDLVFSGQQALARLGYSLKVDGLMGPGTRQAIERFEQDRRLPVTGEFGARTARELSALSGIAVR